MRELASQFAEEIEYDRRSDSVFVRPSTQATEWFFIVSNVRSGVGEFTPCVGVEIPALDKLITMAPGLERGELPTMGGPLFRFVDLRERPLHDFILKVSSSDDVPAALVRLRALWNDIGSLVLHNLRTPSGWLREVDKFVTQNGLGALNVPTAGRVSVAMAYAARGRDAAEHVLQKLGTRGANGAPFQDYAEAQKLLGLIDNDPHLLDDFKFAFGS